MITKLEQAARQALEALCQLHFAATERDKKNRVRWFDKAVDDQAPIGAILYALQDSVGRNVSFANEQK